MVKLIVGLGNPGPEYENTRHNAGAWYVNALARQFHVSLKAEAKFFGYTARLTIAGQDIITFMNRSGHSGHGFIVSPRTKFWWPMMSWIYHRV